MAAHELAATIQRQLSIGSRVTLFRADGETVSGVLSEIGRDHLTVEDDQRHVTLLLNAITGWESASNEKSTRDRPTKSYHQIVDPTAAPDHYDLDVSRPRTHQRVAPLISPSETASELYRDAALAQTEGRIQDARSLFQQAIDTGGGLEVYEAFFKMEWGLGARSKARAVFDLAIERFRDTVTFFVLYGHSERHRGKYVTAAQVFRIGIKRHPENAQLRMGLAQSLVQIGTADSLYEAGQIFATLDSEGKLHKKDNLYQRFRLLQGNPRVNIAFEFFPGCFDEDWDS